MAIDLETEQQYHADAYGEEIKPSTLETFYGKRSLMSELKEWAMAAELGICSIFLAFWLLGMLVTWTVFKYITALIFS